MMNLGVAELLLLTLSVLMLLGPVLAGAFLAIRLSGRRRQSQ